MTAAHDANGWPDLDPARPPRDIDEAWPRISEALDYIKGAVSGAQGEARMARAAANEARANSGLAIEHLRQFDQKLDAMLRLATPIPPLPPMRPESPSTVDLAERTVRRISNEFEQVARTSSGPSNVVQASPALLVEKVRAEVEQALAQKEAETKARADAAELERRRAEDVARLQAVKDRRDQLAKDRRKVVLAVVIAFLAAIATGAGGLVWGKAQGHLEERTAPHVQPHP